MLITDSDLDGGLGSDQKASLWEIYGHAHSDCFVVFKV